MSVTAPPTSILPVGTWSIDPAHSTVEFAIKHVGIATVKGYARGVSGTIEGGDEPSLTGVVDASTLTTHDENRDGHLLAPDFFDVERYPELRFSSTEISSRGDEVSVHGELTIKGVTSPVELRGTFNGSATDPWGNERIGLELEGWIDRTEYGLRFNAPLPGGGFLLADDVRLSASFSAVKAA